MRFEIEILRSAQRSLSRIQPQDQKRITEAIRALADEPRPQGCIKLSGRDAWRIRIGNYRVIYEIQDDKLVILIVAIGHRREVYG
ncbi:MAG: type II toxin-antitoxin system RelE/ParE family toxin [Planctomycetota bacterium]|nr:type II toxin-antitoxin system RelE/ParE family toxin [Planctomycetota bacterium]